MLSIQFEVLKCLIILKSARKRIFLAFFLIRSPPSPQRRMGSFSTWLTADLLVQASVEKRLCSQSVCVGSCLWKSADKQTLSVSLEVVIFPFIHSLLGNQRLSFRLFNLFMCFFHLITLFFFFFARQHYIEIPHNATYTFLQFIQYLNLLWDFLQKMQIIQIKWFNWDNHYATVHQCKLLDQPFKTAKPEIMSWTELLAPLVNVRKEGCENKSA